MYNAAIREAIENTVEVLLETKEVETFLKDLSKHYIYSFGSDADLTQLNELIYGNNQDEILDFITLFVVNLRIADIEPDVILDIYQTGVGIHSSTLLEELGKHITVTKVNDVMLGALYLMRVYIKVFVNEIIKLNAKTDTTKD